MKACCVCKLGLVWNSGKVGCIRKMMTKCKLTQWLVDNGWTITFTVFHCILKIENVRVNSPFKLLLSCQQVPKCRRPDKTDSFLTVPPSHRLVLLAGHLDPNHRTSQCFLAASTVVARHQAREQAGRRRAALDLRWMISGRRTSWQWVSAAIKI